jgi:CHAT domain-containing protein
LKGKTHWHFSTHGSFDSTEPRRSALAMKDSASLSVGSLLERDDLGRPRLVVLSACESGVHDIISVPEEFIGLPGAFMSIGARAVLGTLWQVDDRATAMLMARFYDHHLSEGLAPAAALRKAQLWIRFATRDELSHYARAAEAKGHISAGAARHLERVVLGAATEAVRFFDVAHAETPVSTGAGCQMPGPVDGGSGSDRPFAHPVYWGGFIITGL